MKKATEILTHGYSVKKGMRCLCLLTFFVAVHSFAFAQQPRPKWVDDLGGSSGFAQVTGIVVDNQNNIYVTGGFSGTVDFDPSAGVTNLSAVGGEFFFDIFIGKYKQDGTLLWVKSMGGSEDDMATSVAVDKDANVSIVGYFNSPILDADPGPGVYNLTGKGNINAFIIHLDSNGNFLWANSLGNATGTTNSFKVATDSQDNIITTSQFSSEVTIGDSTYKKSGFAYDGLVAKYGPMGIVKWSLHLHGVPGGNTEPYGVKVDGEDNIVIAGIIDSTINFNPLGIPYNLTAANHSYSAFVAKYNPSGGLIWVNPIYNSVFNESAISIDRQNNIYFNTIFAGSTMSPSSITFGSTVLNSTYLYNACIAKYSPAGILQFAKSFGGNATAISNSGLNDMSLDSNSNVYLTGFLSGDGLPFNFDPNKGSSGNLNLIGEGFYVAKYDSAANYINAFDISTQNCSDTRSFSIIIDNNNNIDVAGKFCATENFDQSKCSSYNVTAVGASFDAFIVQYTSSEISKNIIIAPTAINFCTNAPPETIAGTLPTAGSGTYTYQWLSSTDSVTFADINGAIAQNYTPPTITATTYYERMVSSDTCTVPTLSNIVGLHIFPALAVPVVTIVAITSSSVIISWAAVPGATGYEVSTDNGNTYTPGSGLTDTISNLKPGQSLTITVEAAGSIACQLSVSAAVTAKVPAGDIIYCPNAFTPNGDGRNDVWNVEGENIQSVKFFIYDQWGEQLFTSTSLQNGWDGTYKGTKEPVGVYAYYLEAVMNDGSNINKKGTITLLK